MEVKLISLTKPCIEGLELSAEELIVYTARVSNPENQTNMQTAEKLLKYLITHKHWSPFEMCDMTVEVKTTRAIAAQIIRHKSLSVQEFSQRYSQANQIEGLEIRRKGQTNRQSSEEVFDPQIGDKKATDLVSEFFEKSQNLYNELIEAGVAKECARGVLPLNTQTTLYLKGSVRSWIHYLQVRCTPETQLEHRQVAEGILKIFSEQFPIISKNILFL